MRKGFLGSLTKAVDDIRLMNFKDSNEEFHQLRISNSANIKNMKDASTKYQHIVDTEHSKFLVCSHHVLLRIVHLVLCL